MADGQVTAFHDVLGQNLPMGVPDVGFKNGFGGVCHVVVTDKGFDLCPLLRDGQRVRVQRRKDPAQPVVTTDIRQTVDRFAKSIVLIHRKRPAQRSVQIVNLGVTGADNATRVAAAFE